MKPWELLGWGLFVALFLFAVAVILAIPFVYRMVRKVERDHKEIEQQRAEQRETIRRQRGRFGLDPRD